MVIFLFWLGAMLLALLALALLLPPLLRGRRGDADAGLKRRQLEQSLATLKGRHDRGEITETAYAAEREHLSAQLIAAIEAAATPDPAAPPPARGLALVLAVLVPVLALALYFSLGRPDALDYRAPAMAGADADGMPMDMNQAVTSLEQRLREEPDNLEGWLLLARSYRAMERFDDMLRATSSAMALAPGQPHVMVEHAEAVALAGPTRRLDGQARVLLEQALAIDPQQHKALWLIGIAELQQDNHLEAIVYWQRLRALLEPGDPVLASLDQQISAARARAGLPADTDPAAAIDSMTAMDPGLASVAPDTATGMLGDSEADDGPLIQIQVELDPALAGQVRPGDTLFVFARAPEGGPPLAIRRVADPQFPVAVTLGAAHRMIDGVQLRTGEAVSLGARLSHSGQAQAQSGDLEAELLSLTPSGQDSVQLRIENVLP